VLVLEGALVTIDAMGTQTPIAEQIVKQGGDYLLAVKGNHKTMLQELDNLFTGCDELGLWMCPMILPKRSTRGMVALKFGAVHHSAASR